LIIFQNGKNIGINPLDFRAKLLYNNRNINEANMTDTSTKEKVKVETNFDLKEPGRYKVIYINDELTTMEFVIETLLDIFDYNPEDAEDLTHKIHDEGSAVVAVYPYEIAEQKGVEVTVLARSRGFPLQVKIEKE